MSLQKTEEKLKNVLTYISALSLKDITLAKNYQKEDLTGASRKFNILFPAGFLLHSLSFVPNKYKMLSGKIVTRLATFLKSEMSHFSYNYFTRSFMKSHKQFRVPNDLDDTSLILSALQKHNLPIDERSILGFINLEIQEGGPYITWYVDKTDSKRQDIDPIINTHLLYFLSLLGIELLNTRKYVFSQMEKGDVSSPYYPYDLFFYFNIAKYCKSSNDKEMMALLIKKLETYQFRSLNLSEKLLFIAAKATISEKLSVNEKLFLENLPSESSKFPEMIICYDFSVNDKQTFTASSIMTAALWIECVSSLLDRGIKKNTRNKNQFKHYFLKCKKLVKQVTSKTIQHVLEKSFPLREKQISVVLPIMAVDSIKKNLTQEEEKAIVTIACTAYLGWAGFTILDHTIDSGKNYQKAKYWKELIDAELETIKKLREVNGVQFDFKKMSRLNKKTFKWYQFEAKYRLDKLTNEHIQIFRRGTYIINKTMPFIFLLASIPLLLSQKPLKGRLQDSHALTKLMKSIMIIRQLGDDAHDWKQDLKEKSPTIATVQLIGMNPHKKETDTYFWEKISPQIVKKSDYYAKVVQILFEEHPEFENLRSFFNSAYSPILELKKELKSLKKLLKYYEAK